MKDQRGHLNRYALHRIFVQMPPLVHDDILTWLGFPDKATYHAALSFTAAPPNPQGQPRATESGSARTDPASPQPGGG